MLDDLDESRRIGLLPAPVAIGERAMQQGDAPLGRAATAPELQPLGRSFEGSQRSVDAEELAEPFLRQEARQQLALAQ
jgi:hypothetical protein